MNKLRAIRAIAQEYNCREMTITPTLDGGIIVTAHFGWLVLNEVGFRSVNGFQAYLDRKWKAYQIRARRRELTYA